DFARELGAASGKVATMLQSGPAAPATSPNQGDATIKLGQAIEAAKALVQIAETGHGLQVGQLKGSSEVTVQLKPESLGKLEIKLERTSAGVTAQVTATTEAGRQAVEESLPAIQQALQEAGVPVTSIEVT